MKKIILTDWERFEILMLIRLIEERHRKENKSLPFKISYKLKRIKDKLKLDLSEYEGKLYTEIKPILDEIKEDYELPVFTEVEIEEFLIFSDEITVLQEFIVTEQ